LKEDFAVTVRNQSQESSEHISDELGDFFPQIPNKFKKKKKKKDRSSFGHGGFSEDAEERTIDLKTHRNVDPVRFCSRSEAICAELLQRFVPHFQLKEGATFQVGIGKDERGNTRTVDFLVDGVLFEYHPVRFFKNKRRCGDFQNTDEYRAYTRTFYSLSNDNRDFFHSVMKARLAENYFRKRRALLDQHPIFRRMELIVATSPEEFYSLVIRRFGKNYPKTVERFMALFNELRTSLPD
jgi:hypothetical protein